jgi:S-adenosylmethionine hydrolase
MIITLTTDFGLSDAFVGIMKGVILRIAPDVQIVDITHDIRSYDISEGIFVVNSAYRYFPAGTIHVVVVDPGVGSSRRAIAASGRNQYFIGPDNGVLSGVLEGDPNASVYEITNKSLFEHPVSRTFHGRDIFAPTAAHLARGTPIESVGERITDFIIKPLPQPRPAGADRLLASVLRIDKYGNIITNLRARDLHEGFSLRVAGLDITQLCHSFSESHRGEFFAIEGSAGFIEIALSQGSAADRLRVARGAEIEVETGKSNGRPAARDKRQS